MRLRLQIILTHLFGDAAGRCLQMADRDRQCVGGIVRGWRLGEGTLAIEMGATAEDLKLTIHPHPTLSETLMESAEVFFGQSTHVYKPKRK